MLIGLAGKTHSGKDICADVLVQEFCFSKIAFASPIKALVKELFNMTEEQVNGKFKDTEDARYKFSPRWLMQYVGTDVFRKLYPNIWVDLAIRKATIQELVSKLEGRTSSGVVISDVRFANEVYAIQQAGGRIWKIVRLGDTEEVAPEAKQHSSETELDKINIKVFDAIITAESGAITTLQDKVRLEATKLFP